MFRSSCQAQGFVGESQEERRKDVEGCPAQVARPANHDACRAPRSLNALPKCGSRARYETWGRRAEGLAACCARCRQLCRSSAGADSKFDV